MTQAAVNVDANTLELARQTGVRIANVFFQLNSNVCRTESTLNSGTYDVVNTAGIPEPNAAIVASVGAAGALTGTYSWYCVLVDGTREIMGNPNAQSNSVVLAAERGSLDLTNITNEAANSRVTHIDIYRNLNGGSVYYFVARITAATTSYTDNSTDATIQANDTLELDNNAPTAETYGVAKGLKGYGFSIGAHNGIGGTAYEHDFTWAKLNRVDNQPTVNRTKIEPGLHGRLVTMEPIGDVGAFYKERCIYEHHFDLDPSGTTGDGFGKTVHVGHGTVNDRCVANYGGKHFVLDENSIYVNSGGTDVTEIHKPLKHYWERINWTRKRWFCAGIDNQAAYFFVALDGDTECRHCFVFDLNAYATQQAPRWYVYEYDFGIRDCIPFQFGPTGPSNSALNFGMAWKRVACILTEHGYTGFLQAGYRDLVDPLLTATGTTTGGSTTTLVDSAAVFTYTNYSSITVDVVGAYIQFVNPAADNDGDFDTVYRITAVSGTTLTFTPALTVQAPTGTTYIIGRIPNARMSTPVMGFDVAMRGKRAARTGLEFQPGGLEYTIGMEIQLDRRAAKLSGLTRDIAQHEATQYLPGVRPKLGGATLDGGRIGCQAEPASGDAFRYMQIVLDGSGVDKPAIVDAILIDAVVEEVKELP